MPLMLLFQVHKKFLPVFLVWFVWSEPLYIILYILRSLWVQEHTNVVSLCLFWTSDFCVSGCLFLCAFHVISPFAFDMSNCSGKTWCESLTVLWVFLALGGRFLHWTCLPDLPSEWFALRRGWQWDIWWGTDYHERLTYTIPLLCLFLVPNVPYPCEVCVYRISVWAKSPIPLFTLNLALIAPTPSSPYPSSQPLRIDVAVLSTSSRGQDPTFS